MDGRGVFPICVFPDAAASGLDYLTRQVNVMRQFSLHGRRCVAIVLVLVCACLPGGVVMFPDSALARGNAYANAERACRETTADRLRVHSSDVTIAGAGDISVRGDRLEVHWSSASGASGVCICIGARVVSWEQRSGARAGGRRSSSSVDPGSACAASVAVRIKKRTSDVDIEEVEVRHRDKAVVHWVSYQGERGTCLIEHGQVKRVEFE